MAAKTNRGWDVVIGATTPILAVVGLLIGVGEYAHDQDAARAALIEKDKVDYQHQLWQEKLATYRTIVGLAGKIAFAAPESESDHTRADFEAAYWGTMILVEDPAVERAMMAFHTELHNQSIGFSSQDRLKTRSAHLAEVCRESLVSSAK